MKHEKFYYDLKIEMTTNTELFAFHEDSRAVFLSNAKRSEVLKGDACPAAGEYTLEFKISSNLVGTSTQTISIQVVPAIDTSQYHITEASSSALSTIGSEEIIELDVKSLTIDSVGKLVIRFNKPILRPLIKTKQDSESRRLLT